MERESEKGYEGLGRGSWGEEGGMKGGERNKEGRRV